jgi:hypothetical protein
VQTLGWERVSYLYIALGPQHRDWAGGEDTIIECITLKTHDLALRSHDAS